MIDRRGFLSRAAVLLGTLVALPMVTLAADHEDEITHGARGIRQSLAKLGACEPDGTLVSFDAFPWYQLQRDLNDYARERGYMVELEQSATHQRITGTITPLDPRREDRLCFYIPPSLNVVGAAQEYARRRVRDGIHQLNRVSAWTDGDVEIH